MFRLLLKYYRDFVTKDKVPHSDDVDFSQFLFELVDVHN
jgi:hypothetical protein